MAGPEKKHHSFIVFNQVGISVVIFLAAWYAVENFAPISIPNLPTLGDRLTFALRWQAFPLAVFVWAFLQVHWMRGHIDSPSPLTPKGDLSRTVEARFLSNTVEQYIFHLISNLMAVTFLDVTALVRVPIWAVTFALGRIIYFLGYRADPVYRLFGFGFTFVPSAFALLFVIYSLIFKGHAYLL